ncbi:MAG: hypothetical protein H6815_03985 [Phycisphaeraceae bacterium]|nr:hypothetical protein [Phycisphaerales bacterium]MCB9859590.1 hypothetical protein [Phycisphaeraceae bacterium]
MGCHVHAQPEPIYVLTLDSTRTELCGSIDYNFLTGNAHAAARDAMLDPANFGPGGIVERPIVFLPPVANFRCEIPAETDVLVIPASSSMTTLELSEVRLFSLRGGIIALGDTIPEELDYRFDGNAVGPFGPATGTITTELHPVIDGPFGAVSGSLPLMTHAGFTNTASWLVAPLVSTPEAIVIGAWTHSIGPGRTVIAGDSEWLMTLSESGCAMGNQQPEGMTLFLNAVAWVAPDPEFKWTIGCSDCYIDCNGDWELTIFDYICFGNAYASQDPYADCDGNGQFAIFDYVCFFNSWQAGC